MDASTLNIWNIDEYIIVSNPQNNHILLFNINNTLRLPHMHTKVTGPVYWHDVSHVQKWLKRHIALNCTVLRCLHENIDEATKSIQRWTLVENHTQDSQPTRGHWESHHMLSLFKDKNHFHHVQQWLQEDEKTSLSVHLPWMQYGWFSQALSWIKQQCLLLSLGHVQLVEQVRCWSRGYVLRVVTNKQTLYFKALPPTFTHELLLTKFFMRLSPENTAFLLVSEPNRGWMLMEDMHGQHLSASSDLSLWEETVREYARYQIKTLSITKQLLSLGCPDVSPSSLYLAPVETFMHSLLPLTGMNYEDKETLTANINGLRCYCKTLSSFAIPSTIEHGDFEASNVMITPKGPIFFDWSEATISHPFFSLYNGFGGDMWPQLRTAYLEQWTAFASMEHLQQAFEYAQKVLPLQAIRRYQLLQEHHTFTSEGQMLQERAIGPLYGILYTTPLSA